MNDAFPAFFHCHLDDEYETESDSLGFRLRLDAMGIRYKSLHGGGDGAVFLNLSGTTISDLSPLTAFPLSSLPTPSVIDHVYKVVPLANE